METRARPADAAQRTLVDGAGYLAAYMVRRMMTDPLSSDAPVRLIDDSPSKSRYENHNVPVRGSGMDLSALAAKTLAAALPIFIGKANAAMIRKISDAGAAVSLRVKMMRILQEVLEGRSRLSDLREVSIKDLIGRNLIDTQVETVAEYMTGTRVLVMGVGGGNHSDLSRQIAQGKPAQLILLDRDESGLRTC